MCSPTQPNVHDHDITIDSDAVSIQVFWTRQNHADKIMRALFRTKENKLLPNNIRSLCLSIVSVCMYLCCRRRHHHLCNILYEYIGKYMLFYYVFVMFIIFHNSRNYHKMMSTEAMGKWDKNKSGIPNQTCWNMLTFGIRIGENIYRSYTFWSVQPLGLIVDILQLCTLFLFQTLANNINELKLLVWLALSLHNLHQFVWINMLTVRPVYIYFVALGSNSGYGCRTFCHHYNHAHCWSVV